MNTAADSRHSALDSKEVYARLYGEPLFAIPQDLYIPPQALEVVLQSFEGPLDLLLYLIRKQNFDVLDIPMAEVTEQYLEYVEQLRQSNLELAGEYLLMAALLIEIKSRMLLPVKKADTGEEVEDPRAELVRRLLAYEQMKQAALDLDALPRVERDFWIAHAKADLHIEEILPEVCAEDLRQAWQNILRRAKLHQSHTITREQLSVRDHMSQILRRLSTTEFLEFNQLFNELLQQHTADATAVVVVHFLAMLELAKEALIAISQAKPYDPIYLRLAYRQPAVPA
ncbi:ScpA family protein [Paenalcaligenes sp.]|uniref:segregation and condensation protein A n=1 Tax=Paenalcaligenes sp. TaxID=1966342 RepID=UPI0026071B70|nr:ScpA family protein [Paenalcaligenes sp.]